MKASSNQDVGLAAEGLVPLEDAIVLERSGEELGVNSERNDHTIMETERTFGQASFRGGRVVDGSRTLEHPPDPDVPQQLLA